MSNTQKSLLIAIIAGVVTFILTSIVIGADATVSWDQNTEPDLSYYKIYYGTISGDYTEKIPIKILIK